MFNKIRNIKNMGVFSDFDWDNSVRDKDNNIVKFREVNILYGRNYSGKTTLSRIFRSLEKNELPLGYENPQFSVQDNDKEITQNYLDQNDKIVRVFNKDFVKENLRFIIDDDGEINSFAVLGGDNAQIQEKIENIKSELGSESKGTGLYGELKFVEKQSIQSIKKEENTKNLLDKTLSKKASDMRHNNSQFGKPNYNITRIKEDITKIETSSYSTINTDKVYELQSLLKDESKDEIQESVNFDLQSEIIIEKAKKLTEWEISISDPIQELLNDRLLQEWVYKGKELHKDQRQSCGFCGNPLPHDLWEKLDRHFNKESETLREEIKKLIGKIENEEKRIPTLVRIDQQEFYSIFQNSFNEIKGDFDSISKIYLDTLQLLKSQLTNRKDNITYHLKFEMPKSATSKLLVIQDRLKKIINRNNNYSSELSSKQKEAQNALRFNEVHKFISDIRYADKCKKISQLKDESEKQKEIYEKKQKIVEQKEIGLKDLNNQLGDESKGAVQVNKLLNDHFGHKSLSLVAIEDESLSIYKFEIRRNKKKAYNLSEGECSLIAFCYFIAKLYDTETKDSNPIIWIDDPVSSLDSNHIFFIFSLIYDKIVKSKQYKQLFISTHNLDFLKYLKRISKDNIREFFLIERQDDISTISIMPNYMKQYVTEFNYLFHQIYKCAQSDVNDENYQCFYSFGNNARKFLEIFLYYKYPSMDNLHDKLNWFFGENDVPRLVTDKVNNEYSHLEGNLERGSHPVEVPEMKKTAELILEKMENYDKSQYKALLKSIGKSETTNENKY